MQKFECDQCGCKKLDVRYRYAYHNNSRYAVCEDHGHGNRLDVPYYIPNEQVERYLNAKV